MAALAAAQRADKEAQIKRWVLGCTAACSRTCSRPLAAQQHSVHELAQRSACVTAVCCSRRREKELAAVKVTQADIDVIATEAEVDKKMAERRLREHSGSLVEALKSFM